MNRTFHRGMTKCRATLKRYCSNEYTQTEQDNIPLHFTSRKKVLCTSIAMYEYKLLCEIAL